MATELMTVDQKQLYSLSAQIKELMPGGNKLTPAEAKSLAQVALLHGLDPFNGEVWYLKYDDGKSLGVMAGIKGHRRAAHRQLDMAGGGNYWAEFDLLTPEEKKGFQIPDSSVAFRCRLFDSISIRQYVETVDRLCKSGVPWEEVKLIVGGRPVSVGYGSFAQGEKSKMKPHACAMKRAEADALKRRFDLPFGSAVGINGDTDVVDADYSVGPSEQNPAEVQARMQSASAALRGDQGDLEMETPYQPEGMPNVEQPTMPPVENGKPASLKFQAFVTWANEWVKGNGKNYAKSDGLANMYHLLGRIGKLGFASVTEQNADDIKAALESYVKGKVDTQ